MAYRRLTGHLPTNAEKARAAAFSRTSNASEAGNSRRLSLQFSRNSRVNYKMRYVSSGTILFRFPIKGHLRFTMDHDDAAGPEPPGGGLGAHALLDGGKYRARAKKKKTRLPLVLAVGMGKKPRADPVTRLFRSNQG